MRKILVAIVFVFALAASAGEVFAEQTCVQQYGGGVVCGAEAPTEKVVHKPVPAGIADNPFILGGALIVASTLLFLLSRRISLRASQIQG